MGLSLLLSRLHFFATPLVVQAYIWVWQKFRFFNVLTGQAVVMLIPAPQQAAIVSSNFNSQLPKTMTAEERKSQTEKLLKKLNIPYIDHLPLIEEESEARVRTPQEIAKRILVLTYLNYVAEVPKDKQKIIAFLKEQKLWDSVSNDEKKMFIEDLTKQEEINISWRTEATWLLLWTINKVDRLEMPVEEVNTSEIFERLPEFMDDTSDFINSATIRPVSELLDVSDLTYRLHWATRHSELNGLQTLNLNSSIVQERHYAINWVTYYADDWDEITTDT